jgi:long-chain acyl-CoA synthetase
VKANIREQMIQAFGGNFREIVVGGAAFNHDVEELLKKFDFPYTVGYGMTECGPIITFEDWTRFKLGSCGKAAPRMEVKIDSENPAEVPGEIICRGANVMLGYYKNEEATKEVIDSEGWLHTGDLALMDKEGNVTIKGRSKNMILGPSGQNIYPEEIEDKLNNMPYVAESLIISQGNKLVGLVYPDFDELFANGLKNEDLDNIMEENRVTLNQTLPAYSQITKMKIYPEEFEKTPKKSIKRFLYQGAKG